VNDPVARVFITRLGCLVLAILDFAAISAVLGFPQDRTYSLSPTNDKL
jgi:hypothetical protein